jgi:hypothetical protein
MVAFSHSTNASNAGSSMGRVRRSYVFAVSALATFAVALMIQRDMGADYAATATLTADEPDGLTVQTMEKQTRMLERALTSAELIRIAAEDAGMDLTGASSNNESASAAPLSVDDIRRRLTIVRGRGADGCAEVSATYMGHEESSAIRLINSLARQGARQQRQPVQSPSSTEQAAAAAEQSAAKAAAELARARSDRDDFASANEKLLTARLPAEGPVLPSAAETGDSSQQVDLAVRKQIGQLQERKEELKVARQRLLSTMTPDHPHHQMLRDQVAQLQTDIDEASRSLAPAPPLPARTADSLAKVRARQQKLLAELASRDEAVNSAKGRLDVAQSEAADARRLAVRPAVADVWRVDEAEAARRVPHRTTLPSVLIAMAVGIVAGSATLLTFAAVRTIDRPGDVELALHVRLLGALEDAGQPVAGRRRSTQRATRFALLASEATLALCLAAMIMVALLNKDFAAQIVSDPLAGLAEGVRRLPAAVRGSIL